MGNPIRDELIAKTYEELAAGAKQKAASRVWKSTNGYIFLVGWSNASLLRICIRSFTDTLPKSEFRLKTQMDDAGRSVVANIEEGFARPTTKEYLEYLGFSQASLKEVKGDVQRCRQDGFLLSKAGTTLAGPGIDLKDWHEALKKTAISSKILQNPLDSFKGNYRNLEELRGGKAFIFRYSPVDSLKGKDLTYEIFLELINKTDWHLQRLVVSLEEKLAREGKYYQVEQMRLRQKTREQGRLFF